GRHGRTGAGSLAGRRRGALRARFRLGRRARARRDALGITQLPDSARRDDLHAGPDRSPVRNSLAGGTEMNWPQIFLGCFVIGFVLSVMSFAFGVIDAHVHFPWEGHGSVGVTHVGHAHPVGPINFATVTAFLAWFGGTSYLLTSEFRWLMLPSVLVGIVLGLCGAGIVFLFMAKLLWSPNENMQSADYEMVGMLGRLSQPIREGGVGELGYSHRGARQTEGAGAGDGWASEKGCEVVVTGYERGIASVRRWSDLADRSVVSGAP